MDTGRITVTPTGIQVTDKSGVVRMRMGTLGDDMSIRARLYVHGHPEFRMDVTGKSRWDEATKLRKAYGPGFAIYLWEDTTGATTQWQSMGEYGWRYATPPKEIALANYLLEGE